MPIANPEYTKYQQRQQQRYDEAVATIDKLMEKTADIAVLYMIGDKKAIKERQETYDRWIKSGEMHPAPKGTVFTVFLKMEKKHSDWLLIQRLGKAYKEVGWRVDESAEILELRKWSE